MGEDPAIFATALETLAVKAFGDMGQTARLRLIQDRFIAGHSSCELHRHLDSVPPETPIRDVVDRCRVWESHADPAVRQVSKPSPDPIYPAYVVGDADKISETTRVAAVTGQKSGSDQLEDLLRRLLTPVDTPAPAPEVPAMEKLLQRLVAETQESSTSGCESSSDDGVGTDVALIPRGTAPTTAIAAATATRPTRLERSSVFLMSGHAATRCPNLDESLPFMQPGCQAEKNAGGGGVIMIPPRVAMDRRRVENGG